MKNWSKFKSGCIVISYHLMSLKLITWFSHLGINAINIFLTLTLTLNSSITLQWQEILKSGFYLWNCVFFMLWVGLPDKQDINASIVLFVACFFYPNIQHPTLNCGAYQQLTGLIPPPPPPPAHTHRHTHIPPKHHGPISHIRNR